MHWVILGIVLFLVSLAVCYAMADAAKEGEALGELFQKQGTDSRQEESGKRNC